MHPYTEEDALPALEQESTQHTATFYDLSDKVRRCKLDPSLKAIGFNV